MALKVYEMLALLALRTEKSEDSANAQEITTVIQAIDALHQPDRVPGGPQTVFCKACATGWPCPTARALGR